MPVILLLIAFGVTAARAASTHVLPSAPQGPPSDLNIDYRLLSLQPRNGIPIFIIELHSGAGDWNIADLSKLPAFKAKIPGDVRNHISLYFSNPTGWLVVPRSWTIRNAGQGSDGSARIVFVAPQGGQRGWMSWMGEAGCVGCMFDEASGLIPGVSRQFERIFGDARSAIRLVPKPYAISHPNPCTAIFRYRLKSALPVRGAVFFDLANQDLGLDSLYFSLPVGREALGSFILLNFLTAQPACSKRS